MHLDRQFCKTLLFNFSLKPKPLQLLLKLDKMANVYVSGTVVITAEVLANR